MIVGFGIAQTRALLFNPELMLPATGFISDEQFVVKQYARAYQTVKSPAYVSCVPFENPDDFDYTCQQAPGPQVIFRGHLPLFLSQQEWGTSESTGASIWPSAIALSRYMDDLGPNYWRDKKVLELGSGLGLNSLAARALGAKFVTMTDGDDNVLKNAAANMQANFQEKNAAGMLVQRLSFGNSADLAQLKGSYDVILSSDLTYKKEGWNSFVETVQKLSSVDTVVLYGTSPRHRGEWEALQAKFIEAGFRVTDVKLKPRGTGGVLTDDVRIMQLSSLRLPDRQVENSTPGAQS